MAKGTVMLGLDRSLLRVGERVTVAVSGGADSTALLLALWEWNQRKDPLGVELSAVHVHHGLRGEEADGDETFVRALCERLGVPLMVERVDTSARMSAGGEGLEEAARELRYGVFVRLGVDAVATAHTLDDQAETVVMKLLRGAWTEGLSGISPEVIDGQNAGGSLLQPVAYGRENTSPPRPRVVRPLLGVRRAEIEEFLRSREETWREDSSNRDVALRRNRVRHELMPVLRGFNPGIDGLLAGMADVAREEEAFWTEEVTRTLRGVILPGKPVRGGGRASVVGGASFAIEVERLRPMAPALRRRVVRAAVRTIGVRLTGEETAKILALGGFGGVVGVTGKIGSRLELHDGLRVDRTARELQFSRL